MSAEEVVLPLDAALAAVRQVVPPSPLVEAPDLSRRLGVPVHLKLESLQATGSFKVRGAAARILSLGEAELRRGVIACSSGNHGLAVAYVAERVGAHAVVCVPRWVDPVKLQAIRDHGAEAVVEGATYDQAAAVSERLARERGLTVVHPFDDPWVAAGQGTVALEILETLPDVGTVVIPLSGGGLAGGMAWVLGTRGRAVRTVAVSARRARVMLESLVLGRPVDLPEEETVASALAGGIGLRNALTFGLVRDWVDEHVVVEESAIRAAMAYAIRSLRVVVEGGGAVGIAAVLEGALSVSDARPVVVVVSGGNVSAGVLMEVQTSRNAGEQEVGSVRRSTSEATR
ncbi:MAG TPA: pyridoxal-phosphate dependent enzyme [Longimicrobiales bacterium]|jgi:threonine dehydratase